MLHGAALLTCFDEFQQVYEWDDDGSQWQFVRSACKGPIANDPGSNGIGGARIEVRMSGQDVYVDEQEYSWTLEQAGSNGCGRARKIHRSRLRVLKDGTLYEVVKRDGKPAAHKVREHYSRGIYLGDIFRRLPSADNPQFEHSSTRSVAGHACWSGRLKGGSQFEALCIVPLARECPATGYVLPMEMSLTVQPMGLKKHGRTTSLQFGERGQVLKPGSIVAP